MDLFSQECLTREFYKLASRRNQFTPSRVEKIDRFGRSLHPKVHQLHLELSEQKYKPRYRGVLIEEVRGGKRKSRGIVPLDPEDYLVQRLLLPPLLDEIMTVLCTDSSYGRPSLKGEGPRTPRSCCESIAEHREGRPGFGSDLIKYFPSIDREALWERFDRTLTRDWPWRWLLHRVIFSDAIPDQKASIEERIQFWPTGRGVHQGSVLAPVFANFYMAEWDRKWSAKFKVFRYIDDWLVLGEPGQDMESLAEEMKDSLPTGVDCHPYGTPDKTEIYGPGEVINFVGLEVGKDGRVRPSKKALDSFSGNLMKRYEKSVDFVAFYSSAFRYWKGWSDYYTLCGLTGTRSADKRKEMEGLLGLWLKEKGKVSKGDCREAVIKSVRPFAERNQKGIDSKGNSLLASDLHKRVMNGDVRPEDVDDLLDSEGPDDTV